MASEVHLVVVGPGGGADLRLVHEARCRLEHLERRWSRFLPGSDITRLNVSAGEPIEVDADTITLFVAMRDAWGRTGGRFDPTVLPALVGAGYGASKEDPDLVTAIPAGAVSGGCMADIVVDPERGTVAVPREVAVDPGGLGKGLAADLVVGALLDAGATGALVAVGGDLAMAGEPPDASGWRVEVEHPDASLGMLCTVSVNGGGIATSSTRSRRWVVDGRSHHHVIDPATGVESVTDLASVTVFARSGWLAEAYATAALLVGSATVLDELERHELTGVAVALDGRILATPDLEPAVHTVTGSVP